MPKFQAVDHGRFVQILNVGRPLDLHIKCIRRNKARRLCIRQRIRKTPSMHDSADLRNDLTADEIRFHIRCINSKHQEPGCADFAR